MQHRKPLLCRDGSDVPRESPKLTSPSTNSFASSLPRRGISPLHPRRGLTYTLYCKRCRSLAFFSLPSVSSEQHSSTGHSSADADTKHLGSVACRLKKDESGKRAAGIALRCSIYPLLPPFSPPSPGLTAPTLLHSPHKAQVDTYANAVERNRPDTKKWDATRNGKAAPTRDACRNPCFLISLSALSTRSLLRLSSRTRNTVRSVARGYRRQERDYLDPQSSP